MKGFFSNSAPVKTTAPRLAQCGKCGLSKKCISPKMEVTGTGKHKILFVAEAPGEQEDRQGTQLIGDAGKLLRSSLEEVGVDLEDCWKTNAVICRPPKNKIEPYMISCCRPNLLKTIHTFKPHTIVILGASALESLLFQEWKKNIGPLGKWIGWNIPSAQYNAWLCPIYFPPFGSVFHMVQMSTDKLLLKLFQQHLANAINLKNKKVVNYSIEDLKSKVEVILDPRQAQHRLNDLYKKEGILAFDYETTGLKPDKFGQRIVSVSFCLNGEDTFALMINDNKQTEMLSRILQSPKLKKVASNIKFEERWTRAMFGHGVRRWYWDTMLAAHALDNRSQICSIKFQSYIHLGISDYDSHIYPYLYTKQPNGMNKIDQVDPKELLLYNGLDSILEYKIMEKQRKMFK